jgi:hypothetical protein
MTRSAEFDEVFTGKQPCRLTVKKGFSSRLGPHYQNTDISFLMKRAEVQGDGEDQVSDS